MNKNKIEQNYLVPSLLAIDTSQNTSSVAIQFLNPTINKIVIVDKVISDLKYQAKYLLPTIDSLLCANSLSLSGIDALVVSNGPGRFTGLRISLSCIQALAYAFEKKVITVNSLLLQALQFIQDNIIADTENKIIWVCEKAYGEVYYHSQYNIVNLWGKVNLDDNSNSVCMIGDQLKQAVRQKIKTNSLSNYYFVGSGWYSILDNLDFPEYQGNLTVYCEPINCKHSFNYANFKYNNKNFVNYYDLLPEYGSNPFSSD